MKKTYGATTPDASYQAALRLARDWAPNEAPLPDAEPALDSMLRAPDPPRLAPSQGIETAAGLGIRRVEGDRVPGFAAFLDGTQSSRVVRYVDGIPIVHGTVAAVIRVRIDRRLFTWQRGPVVRSRMYIPRALVPAALWTAYDDAGFDPHDSATADPSGDASSRHPFALLERAVHAVQVDREASEQRLAELWCDQERESIFVDGGISKSDAVATSPFAVGVVKSHRTLYADTSDLATLFALPEGSRSTVFEIRSTRRTPVASWYLRLRDPKGRDPMWGLVRIECARHPSDSSIPDRADEISRWVMAEVAPLALPGRRWDKTVYGIRDCEQFLNAVV